MKATTLMLARIIHRQTSHRVLCSNGAQSSLPCTELKQMQAIAILNLSKTLCAQTHALTRIKNCSINMKGWNLEVAYTLTWAYTSDILKLQSKHAAKVPLRRAQINTAKAENFIASKRRIAKLKLWKDAWPKRCLHDTLTLFYWFECVLEHVVSLKFAVCNVSATTCIYIYIYL